MKKKIQGTSISVVWNKMPQLISEAMMLVDVAVMKATFDVEARAKSKVPVDTGALKNSIQSTRVAPRHGRVTVGQEYGVYVEFGTYKTPAQPYLFPAVDEVVPSLRNALKGLG